MKNKRQEAGRPTNAKRFWKCPECGGLRLTQNPSGNLWHCGDLRYGSPVGCKMGFGKKTIQLICAVLAHQETMMETIQRTLELARQPRFTISLPGAHMGVSSKDGQALVGFHPGASISASKIVCTCNDPNCKVTKQPTFQELVQEIVIPSEPTKGELTSTKCECGMDKIGGGWHSAWCPKYEEYR